MAKSMNWRKVSQDDLMRRRGMNSVSTIPMPGGELKPKPVYHTLPCPACGGRVERKTNRRTKTDFWGCTGYPTCAYTAPVTAVIVKPLSATQSCTRCNGEMVLRSRKNNPSSRFFGCSNYPRCTHTSPLT